MKSPILFNDRDLNIWTATFQTHVPSAQSYPCILVMLGSDFEYIYPDDFVWLKVGIGATKFSGSDRYPYTVVEVVSDKKVILQADIAKRTDKNGLSEIQTYEYTPDPDAEKIVVTLRKNGRWVRDGESMKGGTGFHIGHREAYSDPSF